MRPVNAPEGYEGNVYYNDGNKSWVASYRAKGDTWFTVAGIVGHAYLSKEEVDSRAEAAIERHIAVHTVRSK